MASTLDLLAALRQVGADAAVTDLMPFFPENEHRNLSTRLCRLRDHGLCVADLRDGKNYWTLTNKGLKELAAASQPEPQPPAPESAPQPSVPPEPEPPQPEPPQPEPEPEFASQLEYEPDSAPDPIARDLMLAMELEVALDDLRRRLRAPVIPARTERVYREVLAVLPPIVQDALEPLTALVRTQ